MQVRNWIMPVNRKYNLALLLGTLQQELRSKRNYMVLFEYVMLAGINDRSDKPFTFAHFQCYTLVLVVHFFPGTPLYAAFNSHS